MLYSRMRFAMLGAGAVGGYFGAKLARAGQDVTFIARGAHRDAIRENGMAIRSATLGDFVAKAPAESDPTRVGEVDVVVVAVKTYDNDTAYPMITPLLGRDTVVLTLQNGVDNVDELSLGRAGTHPARASDRRRNGAGRHTGDGRARRPHAAMGQVRLPGPVLGIHRRYTAADRLHLAAVAPARDVLRLLSRGCRHCRG
jgi:hypothetical protein